MKRIISMTLASLLLFSIAGCKNSGENNSSDDSGTSLPPEINTEKVEGKLFDNENSTYTIVYDENCGAAVENAAKQLQMYIKQASGVELPIKKDNEVFLSGENKLISLGKTDFFEDVRLRTDYNRLGKDGFIVKTSDANIVIDGNTDRSVLYGVYDFLEKIVGVKFLTYDYTYVPTLDTLTLYELNIYEVPAIANRAYLSRHIMYHDEFASHMRMNNEFIDLQEEWGGLFEYQPDAVHTTCDYVNPDLYYEAHNDWYYHDGEEVADLCYSHVGLLEDGTMDPSLDVSPVTVAAEYLMDLLLDPANDAYLYFCLGQEDRYNSDCCQCSDCQTQAAKYGRWGMVSRFVNAVTRKVKADLVEMNMVRDFKVVTLAYQWSELPPWDYENDRILHESVVPDESVYVRLCPIYLQNYYPMIDKMQTDKTQRIFTYWPKVTDRFMLWSYNTDFVGYYTYYPTIQTFNQNFRLYQDMGMEYVMLQAAFNQGNLWQDDINTYVASKLLWDPTIDAETVRQEFIQYYYCEAAEYVTQFINNMDMQYAIFADESYPSNERPDLGTYTEEVLNPKYWSANFWNAQFTVLDKAIEAIEKSKHTPEWKTTLKNRVEAVRITPQYMVAMKYNEYYVNDMLGRKAFLDSFFGNLSSLGIVLYRENADIASLKHLLGY